MLRTVTLAFVTIIALLAMTVPAHGKIRKGNSKAQPSITVQSVADVQASLPIWRRRRLRVSFSVFRIARRAGKANIEAPLQIRIELGESTFARKKTKWSDILE